MSGISIEIRRSGDSVQISLRCSGDFHAIKVYDRLIDASKKGQMTIGLEATSRMVPPPSLDKPRTIELGR